jgi:iron complex outermembrane recepter protein
MHVVAKEHNLREDRMTKFRLFATSALSGLVLLASASAFAQTAEPQGQEEELGLGEIIVTATKREQALSDVPIAVSAVSGEQLEAAGITDVRALQSLSPSLVLTSSASEAAGTVARIRGIGTTGDNPGLESAVAIFIDGVYRSRNNLGLTELGEVERIEVLRGPQGTLFGRNASAGLINVVTVGPKFEFGGYADATYGNYNAIRVAGGVTGPIIGDTVAARLDAVYFSRDGFFDDAVTGQDYNNRNRYLVRGQILAEPADGLSIRFIADYSNRKEDCCAAAVLVRGPTAGIIEALGGRLSSGGPANTSPYDRISATTPGISFQTDVEEWGVSAEANWDFGAATMTSITAYRDWQALRGQDADFTSLSIFERPDNGQFQQFRTFSQELRFNGTAFEDRLDWLFGAYYANEKLTLNDELRYGSAYMNFANCLIASNLAGALGAASLVSPGAAGCMNATVAGAIAANPLVPAATRGVVALFAGLQPGLGVGGHSALNIAAGGNPAATLNLTGIRDRHNQTSNNWALFTHNVFSITDSLKLTVGVRYTSEKKEYAGVNTSTNGICRTLATSAFASLSGAACALNNLLDGSYTSERKETEWTGTGVLSYKVNDDLLTYASFSKGYKGGGYNLDRSGLALNSSLGATAGLYPLLNSTNPLVSRDTLQFDPEKVDAYELGAKYSTSFFSVNAALFYQKFTNFQLNTFNGINFIVANLPEVKSKGVELEVFASPVDGLLIGGGFTLADSKYGDDLTTPLTGAAFAPPSAANPAGGALFRLPGARLTNAPLYTLSFNAGYTGDLADTGMQYFINGDMRYQSELNSGSDLDIEKTQEGYALVNGRIGIKNADDLWSVELWVRNLFDKDATQVNFDAPLQGSGGRQALVNTQTFNGFLNEPRTFGVTVRTKF